MNALTILVFNSGSSSLKFSYFRMESSIFDDSTKVKSPTESILNKTASAETFHLQTLLNGEIEIASASVNRFYVKDDLNSIVIDEEIAVVNSADAALHIIRFIAGFSTPSPQVIVHRVVHGGPDLRQHGFINDKILRQLQSITTFAPLHNEAALSIIGFAREKFPGLPQVVCFDTTFHRDLPDVAKILPLSKDLHAIGIQRYGFHGLSCESIVTQLGDLLPEKLIIAHLGSGSSITAVKNGQSVDTSMGLTPSGGIMMGTRSGDIDPGVLIYLMREKNHDLTSIEALINHQSGLLGVSGLSSDMRILHKSSQTNPDAQLAIELFCYSATKQVAAMISVLNGVDLLVFTGGIGEHDYLVRAEICKKLAFIGLSLDSVKNQSAHAQSCVNTISDTGSRVAVALMQSNENVQMARHTWTLLSHHPNSLMLNHDCPQS